jgi:CubicO group peptidase (beta-lactamase class C family)
VDTRFAGRFRKGSRNNRGRPLRTTNVITSRRRASFAIPVLAACVHLAGCGGGSSGSSAPPLPVPTPTPTPTIAASAFDAIIAQNYAGGWGVELAVFRNGAVVYTQGYGLRDRGLPDVYGHAGFWGVPPPEQVLNLPRGAFAPDANTIYELASVSKEFTAGAILLLQQDGKLTVNDSVAKYFPSFPNGDTITLLYLMQHRSGLVDYINFGDYPDFTDAYHAFVAAGQTNYQPIADRLATFPLHFAPGTAFEYSNSNYLLLAMIVAKVSGQPFGTFLQQRIFTPLGMTHTQQGYPPASSDFALGYETFGGAIDRAPQWNLAWLAGCGGLTSTVGDIDLWDRAVQRPGLFTAGSLAQMFAPSPFPQSYGTPAAGWFISTLNGHRYVWHDGLFGGFQTMNATFPDDGIEIILLTNEGTGVLPYSVIPPLFSAAVAQSVPAARRRTAVPQR